MSREKEDRPKILFSPLSSIKSESLGAKSWNGSVNGRYNRYTNYEPGLRNAEIRQACFLRKAWLRRLTRTLPPRNSFNQNIPRSLRCLVVCAGNLYYALYKACFISLSPLIVNSSLIWIKPCDVSARGLYLGSWEAVYMTEIIPQLDL